jgi:hypothetical protein
MGLILLVDPATATAAMLISTAEAEISTLVMTCNV